MTIITELTGSTSTATTNSFFDKPSDLAPATKARSTDINALAAAVDTGFDNVQVLTDSMATPAQQHAGGGNYVTDTSVTANVVTFAIDAAVTALTDGMAFRVKLANNLNGAASGTVGALGTFPIRRPDGTNAAGEYVTGQVVTLTYVAGGGGWLQLPAIPTPAATTATLPNPLNTQKAGAVASASNIDLVNITGNLVHITGTATINSINLAAGAERECIADGAFTLQGSSALGIPGGTTLTAAVGDRFRVVGDGSGNAIVTHYQRASGGPVMAANSQTFTASGTFNPQPGAVAYMVTGIGGGAGGGGGGTTVGGTPGLGGAGGAPGGLVTAMIPAQFITAPVTVTIGAGGLGGIATGANGANATPGTAGGSTTFGNLLYAPGGAASSDGNAAVNTPQYGYAAPNVVATTPASGTSGAGGGTNGGNPAGLGYAVPTGGGGGAGSVSGGVYGGSNGGAFSYRGTVYAGGASSGTVGGNGLSVTVNGLSIGTGGAGGTTGSAGPGYKGGDATGPGGGGGGGGASNGNFTGGAGGNGYRGECRVYWW